MLHSEELAADAAVQLRLFAKSSFPEPGPVLPFIMCLKLELSSPWFRDECY